MSAATALARARVRSTSTTSRATPRSTTANAHAEPTLPAPMMPTFMDDPPASNRRGSGWMLHRRTSNGAAGCQPACVRSVQRASGHRSGGAWHSAPAAATLLWREQARAVSGLSRRGGDLAAPRDALRGGQRSSVLDRTDEQVERLLRVRLDELELGEGAPRRRRELRRRLVRLDVVTVLHLVQPVRSVAAAAVVPLARELRCLDDPGIGARMVVD